jgi:hypothetical protein
MARLKDVIAASKPAFTKLLNYSLLLFGSSLGVFFLLRLPSVTLYFGWDENSRDIFSAMGAVITTYLVIGLFTRDAFLEEEEGVKVE